MYSNEVKKLVCKSEKCSDRPITNFIAVYQQSNIVDQYINEIDENSEENINEDYIMFICPHCREDAVIEIVKSGKSMMRNPYRKK